jgi:hypothetical protein
MVGNPEIPVKGIPSIRFDRMRPKGTEGGLEKRLTGRNIAYNIHEIYRQLTLSAAISAEEKGV